ncbi:hypothetical protein HRG09_20920 [Bacillus sp. Xin1]|uniref:hypothetical protein n=1 Tax=Bacillus sp. Xin1 TaxID=2740676 RepID=UPI00157209DE|nr:hypothetical protein [Bacillus sp. Xin1]NSW38446.1 hypothetical protein [Bacillus sp. Xin1]
MPIIGIESTLGNPVFASITLSVVMMVFIVLCIRLKKWRACILSLVVWMYLLILINFTKEIAEIAPKIAGLGF